jgi:hypothetical protein
MLIEISICNKCCEMFSNLKETIFFSSYISNIIYNRREDQIERARTCANIVRLSQCINV